MGVGEPREEELFKRRGEDHRELYVAVLSANGLVSANEDEPELFVQPLHQFEHLSHESLATGYTMTRVSYAVTGGHELAPLPVYPNAFGQAVRLRGAPRDDSDFHIFNPHAIDARVLALNAYLKAEERGDNESLIRQLRLQTHFLHQASNLLRYGRLLAPNEVHRSTEQ